MKFQTFLLCVLLALGANSYTTAKAQVDVNDSLALVDLYNSTSDPHWSHHENWLTTKPVSTWYGVTVTGTRVTSLKLGWNYLKGYIPASIGNLTKLTVLELYRNYLTGSIPSAIGNLLELTTLSLSENGLTDSLPASIGNLTKLQVLYLEENRLTGTIPPSIGNLVNLIVINIGTNRLTGPIPPSIGNLTLLSYLYLQDNHLNGPIPSSIGNLVNLRDLELYINHLSGKIPVSIGNLVHLSTLRLNSNNLSGSIPASIGNLNVFRLQLNHNKLSGSIPTAIGNLPNINYLYLDHNQLSGTIPSSIGNIPWLPFLHLEFNQLNGSIPSTLGNLNIYYLFLNDNQLTGAIPSSLSKNRNLVRLHLNNNKLSGEFPFSSKKLTRLYDLDISHNLLTINNNIDFPMLGNNDQKLNGSYNLFTFNGLEAAARIFPGAIYAPQGGISIHRQGNILSVDAGGTLSNNTYKWFKAGTTDSTIITGDSTFIPTGDSRYYVTVTNAIATKLTLYSDTIDFTLTKLTADKQSASKISISKMQQALLVSPNPAGSIIHVQLNGTADIILTNGAGKIMLTKTIHNYAVINVSALSNGVYYIKSNSTGEVQKIIVLH